MESPLRGDDFLNFAFCSLIFEFFRHCLKTEFPGDYTDGETPEPIPNSEAKPVKPMVVLTGESRYRQDFFMRWIATKAQRHEDTTR